MMRDGDIQDTSPLLVSPSEARRMIGVGNTKLYELINSGDLIARKLGSSTRIEVESIHRLARSLPRVGKAA